FIHATKPSATHAGTACCPDRPNHPALLSLCASVSDPDRLVPLMLGAVTQFAFTVEPPCVQPAILGCCQRVGGAGGNVRHASEPGDVRGFGLFLGRVVAELA